LQHVAEAARAPRRRATDGRKTVRASKEAFAAPPRIQEDSMDQDKLNISLRKFLKQVGVTSQREIERIVRESGAQSGKLKVKMVLTAAGTNLNHVIEDEIDLG
jgi:hypothetical protein